MHFMDGCDAKSDESLVHEVYRSFDESTRLTKSKAAQVEFLTNVKYIERYLPPRSQDPGYWSWGGRI